MVFFFYILSFFHGVYNYFLKGFHPTSLKGCHSIVFTHGVQMGGQAFGWAAGESLGSISETLRCRMLILGTDFG